MEGLSIATDDCPDFSLLQQVLLPPFFASDQAWSMLDTGWTEVLSELQYCDEPHDVAIEQRESSYSVGRSSTVKSIPAQKKQCRKRASRGRKRGSSSRFPERKDKKWCQSEIPANPLQQSDNRMSYMTQVSEPAVIHLLEELVRNIPKSENFAEDAQSGYNSNRNLYQTPYLRNSYRMVQNSPSISTNPMDMLNLINLKCHHLNDDFVPKEWHVPPVGSEGQNNDNSRTEINNNIPKLDRASISSATEKPCAQPSIDPKCVKNDTNPEFTCDEYSLGMQKVKKTGDLFEDNAITSGSSEKGICSRKASRKQKTPVKSVEEKDPYFQGIEFQMHLCFDKEKCDDCQLSVTSVYSKGRNRRKSSKTKPHFKSTSLSSGSEEDQMPTTSSRSKRCASCKTHKTPLWRDAEDGTPLCNACGIRYKKYGIRCGQCWNIPKRDGKSCSRYCACGGMFRTPI